MTGSQRRRRPDPLAYLATGRGSDALVTVLIGLALVQPLAGSAPLSLGPLRIPAPPFVPVTLTLLALVALRATYSRWGNTWPAEPARVLSRHRHLVALGMLVGVGLLVRIHGIEFGLPLITHPDEPSVAGVAIEMLRSGWIDPQWYIYPTFFMNLLLPSFALYYVHGRGTELWSSLQQVSNLDPGFYLVARYHSAVLGALTIAMVYWLAVELWRDERARRVGLVAAAIVATSFVHVRESQYAVTDVPAGFLVCAALVAIARVLRSGRSRDYLMAGLLCGLAGSTKYTAVPILVPLGAAHLLGRHPRQWLDRRLLVALAAIPTGFLIGSPYALLNWKPFLEHLGWLNTYSGATSPDDSRRLFAQVLGYSSESGFGLPIFVVLVLALLWALHRRSRPELLLAIAVVAFVPQWTQTTHRFFPRFLVPLVPVVALLVARATERAIAWLCKRTRRQGLAGPALAAATAALVWLPASESLTFVRFQARLDSRTAAYHFVVDHFPEGTVVASEIEHFRLPDAFTVLAWRPLNEHGLREFGEQGVRIAIAIDRLDNVPTRRENGGRVRERLRAMRELARFGGVGWNASGPEVVIYEIPTNIPSRAPVFPQVAASGIARRVLVVPVPSN